MGGSNTHFLKPDPFNPFFSTKNLVNADSGGERYSEIEDLHGGIRTKSEKNNHEGARSTRGSKM